MPGHNQHRHDAELRDLWKRRAELDETGWSRLYVIVREILARCRPQILSALPEDHDVYVQDFVEDKVYRPDLRSQIHHAGALCEAYERYLIDRQRRLKRRPEEVVSSPNEGDPDGLPPEKVSEPSGDDPAPDDKSVLAEVGLSVEQVARSAQAWLESAESWIPVYLGLNYCPDAEMSEPLYLLVRRLGIANYHVKAQRLGITGNLGAAFNNTMIGGWLADDLGIEISRENIGPIGVALKILCFQALEWVEDQETPS
jgi:hypothetical protein